MERPVVDVGPINVEAERDEKVQYLFENREFAAQIGATIDDVVVVRLHVLDPFGNQNFYTTGVKFRQDPTMFDPQERFVPSLKHRWNVGVEDIIISDVNFNRVLFDAKIETDVTFIVNHVKINGVWHQTARPLPGAKLYSFCFGEQNLQMCGRCKKTWYCGQECQRRGWSQHKVTCRK